MIAVGGLGNISGAIAAGLLFGIVEAYALFLTSAGWQSVLTVFLIVLVMIFRPSGLFAAKGARVWPRGSGRRTGPGRRRADLAPREGRASGSAA